MHSDAAFTCGTEDLTDYLDVSNVAFSCRQKNICESFIKDGLECLEVQKLGCFGWTSGKIP